LKNAIVLTGVLCWLVLALPAGADTAKLLGDESDGSRAVPVHLIDLLGEEGQRIGPDDEPVLPFSTRWTCGECHDYDTISRSWHFNAADANIAPGRPGQPWIFVDAGIGTQIPLSYRSWPGTFHPEQLGMTPFQFTQRFGGHMPGGGVGELDSNNPDEVMRQFVSGKLEINCLSCHNAHAGQDQSDIYGYAGQIARQNFRWAAAASCEFASVSGSAADQTETYDPLMSDAIKVTYREGTFDHKNRVLFDIVREVPAERCYFCHSNVDLDKNGSQKWATDEDVHLAAGLTCVDCHRNGLDHNITRGYEGESSASQSLGLLPENPLAATSTCEGCHLRAESSAAPTAGRLGAPRPKHVGIPPIHFDKLTCTACHSGLWPRKKTCRTKTSRAHGLGLHLVDKPDDVLPHIIAPVFAKQSDGKIAPHKLLWPAFWGSLKGNDVTPIDLETVRQIAGGIIAKERLPGSGDWQPLTEKQIGEVLGLLSTQESIEGKPVYVCGGKLHRLADSGQLSEEQHPAAKPYLWPIAHNVRPAAQSLGIRRCEDCHSTDAPFFFGEVDIDSPVVSEQDLSKIMVEFQDAASLYAKAFAFSFVFRPWLKVVVLGSCAVLAVVLLLYTLKALAGIVKVLAEEN